MSRARWLAIVFAGSCAPHERAQEPGAACGEGMVLVEGGQLGVQRISRLCVDVTEVTTAAYGACVDAGACTPALLGRGEACNLTRAERAAHPVDCASLEQAAAFCAWLGKRLPEDAEWSWLASGGARRTSYPWGDEPPDATRACWGRDEPARGTCEAGSFPTGAGPEGVLDLVGNVAEWTREGKLRGGSWQDRRAAERPASAAATKDATATSGLRCVASPETPVEVADTEKFVPYGVGVGELPVLAEAAPDLPPTRPLANLALLHAPPPSTTRAWQLGDTQVFADPADPAALGLRASIDRAAMPSALSDLWPVRSLGPDLVLMSTRYAPRFVAVERETLKVRWQVGYQPLGNSYQHFIGPRTLVAEVYGDATDVLIAHALDSGREVWRIVGGEDAPFGRIRLMWTDGERGYVHGDRGLFAFDPDTGAIRWSKVAVEPDCGVTAGKGVVVVEEPAGYRVLASADGALTGRIAKRVPGCLWETSVYEERVERAAIAEGRLFAFDPRRAGESTLRAYDLTSGALQWSHAGLETSVLEADHDAVYVARAGEMLVALDAATGAAQAELSIGVDFTLSVQQSGGAAGPLLVVERGQVPWLLGRAAERPAPEAFTVRGRLVAGEIPRRRAAGVLVRVGERRVRTDAGGRFVVRGQARGALRVTPGETREPTSWADWVSWFIDAEVVLDGKGAYDVGELPIFQRGGD